MMKKIIICNLTRIIMQLTNPTLTGFTVLICFFSALRAPAQDTSDTARVYQLDEVIISASRWEQSPQTVGRNVTVITRQEIESSLHTSVGGILSEQQSLHVVGDNQTPGSVQSLFMRNSDSNHTAVMIDGTRISDPSTPGNSIDLAELSLAGVERIEIVRGSHSTLYGSSAIGGVVNIITRNASGKGLNGSVETGHGTFGSGTYSLHNGLSANYMSNSGLYLDLGMVQEWARGLDATPDTTTGSASLKPQDRDHHDKLDLNGKFGYQHEGLNLYLSYRRVDQDHDLDRSAFADDDNARIGFRRDLYSYGGTHELTDRIELSLTGAWSDLRRDFVNDSSMTGNGDYDGTYSESSGEGSLWRNEMTAEFQADRFSAILGVGHTLQNMSSSSYTYSSAFDFESETDLDSLDLRETIEHAFIYTEWNAGLIDRNFEAVTLGLGARLSRHDQFGFHATYEINPKWQMNSSTLLYGALTTGFNAPSLYQLHSPERGFGAYTDRGNSRLEPERSLSVEAGWKQELGRDMHLEITLFQTGVKNAVEYIYLWDKNTAVENLGFSEFRGDTYLNVSEQRIRGVELGIQARLLPDLRLSGSLSYTKATLEFSPDDLDTQYTGGHHVQIFEGGQFVNREKEVDGLVRRPRLSATAKLIYRPAERVKLGLTHRFVGQNDDVFYSSALGPFGALDRSEVDGYHLTDLYAGYRFGTHLHLQVKVENLFDTDYREILGYRTRPRGAYGSVRFLF